MIHSFEIKDPDKTHIAWWAKVPALAKPRTFEFRPGLNILWGKNGSGKTTVVKALAQLFHCEQSGQPVVTQTSIENLFDRFRFGEDKEQKAFVKAISLKHDGQGVRYFDPSVAVGLFGGIAAFDWDFSGEGVANAMFKGSAGQTTMFRMDKLLGSIAEGKVPKVERRVKEHSFNSTWSERLKIAERFLKGSGEVGPPTVLLDEPERSFDLPHQIAVWRFIRATTSRVQYIVASHALYALNIPEAHYIEMEPEYLDQSCRCLKALTGWADEKPALNLARSSKTK